MALVDNFYHGVLCDVNDVVVVPDPGEPFTIQTTNRVIPQAIRRSVSTIWFYNDDTVTAKLIARMWDRNYPAGSAQEYRFLLPEDVAVGSRSTIDSTCRVSELLPKMSVVASTLVDATTNPVQFFTTWIDEV